MINSVLQVILTTATAFNAAARRLSRAFIPTEMPGTE
jgi:hypothetical protein